MQLCNHMLILVVNEKLIKLLQNPKTYKVSLVLCIVLYTLNLTKCPKCNNDFVSLNLLRVSAHNLVSSLDCPRDAFTKLSMHQFQKSNLHRWINIWHQIWRHVVNSLSAVNSTVHILCACVTFKSNKNYVCWHFFVWFV